MIEPNRQQLRAWLQEALTKLDETPTGLARRAGVAQSTLTRFLNNDDAPLLGLRTIAKIAHVAGMEPMGLPPGAAQQRGHLSEADGVPYVVTKEDPLTPAIHALIARHHATDPWRITNHALDLVGFLPGDIVIVSLNEVPRPFDIVCAQSYRWSEGKADTVFRIYEPPYLVAASTDRAFLKPLLVDNDRVVIKGVVTAMLRGRD